ncbi:MAG: mechanosensitive ion channel family protein [Myxococcales bacterium]|nr:mechanosensitive ion channel family protein [Myxococcales bacterium]
MQQLLEELGQASIAFAGAGVALLLAILVSRGLRRLIRRLASHGHLSPIMEQRLQSGRRWAVFVLAGLTLLQATGLFDNAWALLSAVLATVAIGFFAVWSLLSNATSALLILMFRPFRLGDTVELVEPTNRTVLGGVVLDINLMYTTLEETDAETGAIARLQVPNNLFFQKLMRTRMAAPVPVAEPFFREGQDEIRGEEAP